MQRIDRLMMQAKKKFEPNDEILVIFIEPLDENGEYRIFATLSSGEREVVENIPADQREKVIDELLTKHKKPRNSDTVIIVDDVKEEWCD